MRVKQTIKNGLKTVAGWPRWLTITGVVLLTGTVTYGLLFLLERPVAFSYAGETCIAQPTLLPGTLKVSKGAAYSVRSSDEIRIGGVRVMALSLCFTPRAAPSEGESRLSIAPYDGFIGRTTYTIRVPSPVNAYVHEITGPIPGSKPLEIRLDSSDKVFSYAVQAEDKKAGCDARDSHLLCKIGDLELTQGRTYNVALIRQFNGKPVGTVASKDVAILPATTIQDISIKPGETVYSKPKSVDITFDKQVTKAKATLVRIEGDTRDIVKSDTAIVGSKLQLTIASELARSATYEMTIDDVEATDGSGLDAPYVTQFSTSGGPKVTGVNIGTTGVAMGATAVITFDQVLSETQDISKLITLSGGASLASKKGNQLFISLAGVPKCGDFTIKLTNDIQSNYEIGGSSAWNFNGRTVCHTVSTIGTSTNGRAINAYSFGSGSRVVVYTGAIHGTELSSKLLMERWIDELESKARSIPADKTIVVIPSINPDGVAAGRRTNARNVDLNRNFATSDWRKDVTDTNNNPFPGGGGETAMSERETQVLASYIQRVRPVLIVSYHSIGGLVIGNQAGNSSSLASTYAGLSGYRNTTGQSSTTFDYGISGTADDWYAERLGIASVLIELGSHTNPQFSTNQRAMWAMANV